MVPGKLVIRSLALLVAGFNHVASAWKLVDKVTLDRALNNPPALVAFISDPDDQKTRNLEVEWDQSQDEETFSRVVYQCLSWDLLCDGLEASQLPTVLFYGRDKREHIYRGPRSAQAIDQFVQRAQKPIVSRVQKPSQLASLKEIGDGVCVCTASPTQHRGFIAAFERVAARYHTEYTFGFAEIGNEVAANPVVECSSEQGMRQKTFKQAASGIESFVLETLRPVITDLTPHNHKRLLDRRWPMVYIFGGSASQRAELRRGLHDFAASWPDLTTVLVDPLDFPELPARLGLETELLEPVACPAGAVHQLTTGKIWPYPAGRPLDSESLKRWGVDVWQGRVQPWNARAAQGGGGGKGRNGNTGRKTVKSTRQVKLPNVPGLEKLRERLERRDEL